MRLKNCHSLILILLYLSLGSCISLESFVRYPSDENLIPPVLKGGKKKDGLPENSPFTKKEKGERGGYQKRDRSLNEKAIYFEELIKNRHLTKDGLLAYAILLKKSKRGNIFKTSHADTAIWSGCYLVSEAFRYRVDKSSEAKKNIIRLVKGLSLLDEITGKRGLIARSIKRADMSSLPDNSEWHQGEGRFKDYQWLGDVSIDQVNGVIFGYGTAFDIVDDIETKRVIADYTGRIADHIIEHSMQIVDVDGKVTKHGDLTQGLFSENLNALIALSIMKTAYHVTGDERYQKKYIELIKKEKYHKYAIHARDRWWEYIIGRNHSDNNLAFIAYYNLIRYEKDKLLLEYYKKSLERSWNVVKDEANPFFTFIYYALTNNALDIQLLDNGINTLRLFPMDRRNHPVVNSNRRDICIFFFKDRLGRPQACNLLPIEDRPTDSFEWKENPYRLDGGGDSNEEFSGVDYLLPYWLGRYYGFITEEM